jgi:hypothetical protein
MALSKKQREELETKITKVFKISTDPAPEVFVILDYINPAIKSGPYSYSESVSLVFCQKDGTRIGYGLISMTATKFYKKYLNQEVK